MNKDLTNIHSYMTENTLMLNKSKSYYMIFKPKGGKTIPITEKMYINNTEIERVKATRFLGIWIDEDLKFKKQFEVLQKKLVDTLKALAATRSIMNYRAKILIYHSLFQSHLNYGTICYFDKMNKNQLTILTKLQKRAVRILFRANRNVHTQKLFKLANITPIKNLYETEAIKFVFSYISDTTRDQQPKAIHKILFHNTDVTRKTRFHDDESKIKINHEYRKGQAIYNLITIWNNANPKLRFAGNHWSLKNMLRTEINSEMKPCTIRNCFTCTLDRKRNYQNYMTK